MASTSSLSQSRQLFSDLLAQLVSSASPTPTPTRQEISSLIEQSFGTTKDPQPWRTDARRVIVEREIDQLVQQHAEFPATEEQQKRLETTLDLLLSFVEAGYVDENVPLQTLAGLMELRPISACEPLLSYIETRVDRLTKGMEYQRGRGPILLRLLNDLLRRLPRSQSGPVILSGRILMLLSSVYPLGEKSGVNLRGNFNIGKGTVWEPEPEPERAPVLVEKDQVETVGKVEEEEKEEEEEEKKDMQVEQQEPETKGESQEVKKMEFEEGEEEEKEEAAKESSPSFYSTFWSLQKFFNNPHLLFTATSSSASSATPISTLHSSLLTVLTAFSAETKREKELSGSSSSNLTTTTTTTTIKDSSVDGDTKGKQVASTSTSTAMGESMVMGEKDEPDKTGQSLEQYFFPKFLTSRNLLSLELSDPTFRLQLLLQTLILTQYLLSLTPSARARVQALPLTNTSAFPNFVLESRDEDRVKQVQDESWKQIENMQGGGKVRRAIEKVLERERNWTDWKLRSCLPFTKPSIEVEPVSTTVRTKLQNMTRPPPKFPYKLGNARLSRVWSKDVKTLNGFEPDVTEDEFDSIVREWRMTKKRLEMTRAQIKQSGPLDPKSSELQASIEPMTIKLQALQFRALRSASTTYLRHFSKIGSGDLDKLLEEIENERRKREEAEEAREAQLELDSSKPSGSVDTTTAGEGEGGGGGGDAKNAVEPDTGGGVIQVEAEEEKKAAIRLGDTPTRVDDTIDEEDEGTKDVEAGTPPPPPASSASSIAAAAETATTTTTNKLEPGTPKRPREESTEAGERGEEEDVEMQEVSNKKQKI